LGQNGLNTDGLGKTSRRLTKTEEISTFQESKQKYEKQKHRKGKEEKKEDFV